MAPSDHLLGKRRQDHLSSDKETEHLAAQPLGKKRFRYRRQRNEASRSLEDAVGDERVHVGVEVDQVAEGLDKEDEAGAGVGQGSFVGLRERSRDDAAELSEKRPTIGEERADELWNREDVLPGGTGRSTLLSTQSP
jgi:hypothetical protein